MNRPTHTLNPNTGREITINGVREKLQSMEFASGNFWNMDSNTMRNWIACTTHLCLRVRRSTFPSREWFLQAIVRWSLVVRHTTSYSVTTIDHKAANGWRWAKRKPKSTIMIRTSRRYSQTTRTMIRQSLNISTSMNLNKTKTAMRFSHSGLEIH